MKKTTIQKQIKTIDEQIVRVDRDIKETKRLVETGDLPSWRADKELLELEFTRKDYVSAKKIWEGLEVTEDEI